LKKVLPGASPGSIRFPDPTNIFFYKHRPFKNLVLIANKQSFKFYQVAKMKRN